MTPLEQNGIPYETFQVRSKPDFEIIDQGITATKNADCDMVIGFGRGIVIATAETIAAMLTNPG